MEPLKVLASPSVEKGKRMGRTTSPAPRYYLVPGTTPFSLTPPTCYPGPLPWHSLAVTPGLVLPPLSGSMDRVGSRGVKSSSIPGPTSRSFRPSTAGKEEVRTGATENPAGDGRGCHSLSTRNMRASRGIPPAHVVGSHCHHHIQGKGH